MKCELDKQGFQMGDCLTMIPGNGRKTACEAALGRDESGMWKRFIRSAHLGRPEHYFSIYMSVCNMNRRERHTLEFTKTISGE